MRLVSVWVSLCFLSISCLAATPPTSKQTAVKPTSNVSSTNNLPIAEVERFTTAIADVKKYYVEDVSDNKLFDNALQGMIAGLDPHSSYLDADDYADLRSTTSGKFAGVGIEIGSEAGYIRIVSPIDDTPAQKAGLKPGDFIIKIDNESVQDMSLRDAVDKMRGKAGTQVVLTIYREGEKAPFNVTLTREVIKVESVKSKLLDGGYGYIRISQFQSPTADALVAAVKKLQADNDGKPLNGLILDLRNNPGGLLDAAIDVSDTFLDSKKLGKNDLIVYTKGRIKGSQFDARATPGDMLNGAPIVVLINGGSASASEIVAGALQDQHRAIIMGTQSFGKGSVQTVIPLDNKTAIKITTALYYTPNGRSIQAKGIEPDVVVEPMKVTSNKNTEDFGLAMLKEQDLKAHLANGNEVKGNIAQAETQAKNPADNVNTSQTKANKANVQSTQPLAVTDYQLNEALNLLKGLHAVGGV
ncbi:MAG: S41 family peptidase [Gammaproteobacteria bacterium]|nr:S41 family peptidase [Gammaproteobacteria bacterium]